MSGLTLEKQNEIIMKGWIIHETKKRNLGPNFHALYDKVTGRYCDPSVGWVNSDPRTRKVINYDQRRKRERMGMEAIFNFEEDEAAIYLFSLYADKNKIYWEMDGVSMLVNTPSGMSYHARMMENGKLKACVADDFIKELFKSDYLHISSIIVNEDKMFPKRDDAGRLLMAALGEVEFAYGLPRVDTAKSIQIALGLLNNSIITSIQMGKILRIFQLYYAKVGDGAMLDFLSKHSCVFALEQFLVIGKSRASHNWIVSPELEKSLVDKVSPIVWMNMRLEAIENILQIHNVMKVKRIDELDALISYLEARKRDITKEGRRFKMIEETEAILRRVVNYGTLNKWKEELN